jgi:hypothetical protein
MTSFNRHSIFDTQGNLISKFFSAFTKREEIKFEVEPGRTITGFWVMAVRVYFFIYLLTPYACFQIHKVEEGRISNTTSRIIASRVSDLFPRCSR